VATHTLTQPNNTHAVALGDLNGDGALDLVVANENFNNKDIPSLIYFNDGQGGFPQAKALGEPGRPRTVALGDLDGDGDLDIVLGREDQPNLIYFNDGQGGFPADEDPSDGNPKELSAPDNKTRSVALGDLNDDDRLDIVAVTQVLTNVVYLNQGGGNFEYQELLPPPDGDDEKTESRAVVLVDFNGDAALDIAVGRRPWRKNLAYLSQNGHPSFLEPPGFFGEDDNTASLAAGDFDGDGTIDLLVGNGAAGTPPRELLYLNKEGNGLFSLTNRVVFGGADFTQSLAVGDFNGDAAIDVVVGNRGEQNQLYLNDGLGIFFEGNPFGEIAQTRSLALGDLDNNGTLDLVTGNVNQPNLIYLNDGTGSFSTTTQLLAGQVYTTNGVALGDLNRDSWLDIVIGNQLQPGFVCWNQGAGVFTPKGCTPFGGTDHTLSLTLADLDNQGSLDLVVGNLGVPDRIYLTDETGVFTSPVPFVDDVTRTFAVTIGDLNGDSALDLITGNQNEQNVVYLNDGAGGFPSANPFGGQDHTQSLALGDLNADGRLDLVVGNRTQQDLIYLNDGSGLFTAATSFGTLDNTKSLLLGDLNGDGRLDMILGNDEQAGRIYLNAGQAGFIPANTLPPTKVQEMALGDLNNDGTLDLVVGNEDEGEQQQKNLVYLNKTRLTRGLPNNMPYLTVVRPVATGNANFYSTPVRLDSPVIPISYTLFDLEGDPAGQIKAYYSLNGGGHWQPALPTSSTPTTNLAASPAGTAHIFYWDLFASGLFGQSDNVVVRLELYPQPVYTGVTGSYSYTNKTAGLYQWPYASATTFPFRVRGTQVRVLNGTTPVPSALVYRLPQGQLTAAVELGQTDVNGYLQGGGQIELGDQLLALAPLPSTLIRPELAGDKLRLYYTNSLPNETGLTAHTVVAPGVQQLQVSADYPLLLLDIKVSLEWDASKDPLFLAQLEQNLLKSSAALYDWSNGQVALGRITVYQDKEQWTGADIRLYASNQARPIADQGGIVAGTLVLTHPDFTEPLTATTGEIRLGPTWNRYGDPQPIGADWPNVLAHELSHYALFLEDSYLGIDPETGLLVPVETCTGTAMSDPYDEISSEFLFDDGNWEQTCGPLAHPPSLAELPDWEMLNLVYSILRSPSAINPGPSAIPPALTQVEIKTAPTSAQPLLDDFNITVPDALAGGRAYLLHPGHSLVDLGRPVLDSILAHGARAGDELCLFAGQTFACSLLNNSGPAQLNPTPAWLPEILLTLVNSTTLDIVVNDPAAQTVTLYPDGQPPVSHSLNLGRAQVSFDAPAAEMLLEIKGDDPNKRVITGYAAGAGPGRKRGHGGPGRKRGHGGPFASGDGSVLIYPPETLPADVFTVLQTAISMPELPAGLKPVGRAYYLRTSAGLDAFDGGSLAFQYLGLDVLLAGGPQAEESLAVYFWDGAAWSRLETSLNRTQNFASAPLPGVGLYLLTTGQAAPQLGGLSPAVAEAGSSHTLTITGQNFLAPLAITLHGQTGLAYPLSPVLVTSQTVIATTPPGLPADLYDLELVNAGGLAATQEDAFTLTTSRPGLCFFDDFASGWGKWSRTGEWDIIATGGEEAATDSPNASYLNAEPGLTRTTTLTSQPFSLATCPNPLLEFRHDYRLAIGPAQFQDWGLVELSLDDGQTWQTLASYTGGGSYEKLAAAVVDEWGQTSWQTATLELAETGIPTTSTTTRLRFNLIADAEGSDKGWLLDDISLKSSQAQNHTSAQATIYLPLLVKETP
jgi:hypothetical protein